MPQLKTIEMNVRPANTYDTHVVAALAEALGYPGGAEAYERRLRSLIEHPDHLVALAEGAVKAAGAQVAHGATRAAGDALAQGASVKGWIHIFVKRMLVMDVEAEIGGLVVNESARGQGVGRALVEYGLTWAARHGCRSVRVRSNVVRDGAHDFYPHLGFEKMKTQHVYRKSISP